MSETKNLVQKIVEGIQEKKGKNIVVADLTSIHDTICKYFVICQGNSPSQVSSIVDEVWIMFASMKAPSRQQSMDRPMHSG